LKRRQKHRKINNRFLKVIRQPADDFFYGVTGLSADSSIETGKQIVELSLPLYMNRSKGINLNKSLQ
jgi:hypothetical protein